MNEYLEFGDYPEVAIQSDEHVKEKLLKTYFDEIFFSDFVERHEIKSIDFARFLFEFAFQNFSCKITVNKIKNFLKDKIGFTDRTMYNYFEKIQDTLSLDLGKKMKNTVFLKL